MNNKEKRKDECPICLSKIRTEAYLDSCTHVFCKKCIKKWSENQNTCPICKVRFNQISRRIRRRKSLNKTEKRGLNSNIKQEAVITKDQKSMQDMMEENIFDAFNGPNTRQKEQEMLLAYLLIHQIVQE